MSVVERVPDIAESFSRESACEGGSPAEPNCRDGARAI
jgi:hypothetical protein